MWWLNTNKQKIKPKHQQWRGQLHVLASRCFDSSCWCKIDHTLANSDIHGTSTSQDLQHCTPRKLECVTVGNKAQKHPQMLKSLRHLLLPSPRPSPQIFLEKHYPFDTCICKLLRQSLRTQGLTSTSKFSRRSDPAERKLGLLWKHGGTARDDWLYRKHNRCWGVLGRNLVEPSRAGNEHAPASHMLSDIHSHNLILTDVIRKRANKLQL